MRRLIPLLAIAVVLAACAGESAPTAGPPRSAEAGEVEVTATPVDVGGGTAVFELAFDTHTVDLDFDPAAIAVLDTPSGRGAASWDGAGPGSHHREGELRFDTDAALDEVALTIELDETVVLDWRKEE